MKRLPKKIFAVWGLIIFILSMILLYPVFLAIFLFNKKKSEVSSHKMRGFWGSLLLFFFMIRVKKHYSRIDYGDENCIFICNHRSMLDIIVCNVFIPVRYVFLAKHDLAKIPLFGYIISQSTILVNRKSNYNKMDSYNELKKILLLGGSVLLFPEGKRNNTDQYLTPFQNGAFRLAVETEKPVRIVTLWDTGYHMSKQFELVPGKIDLFIDGPFYPEKQDPKAMTQLKEKCVKVMSENIRKAVEN